MRLHPQPFYNYPQLELICELALTFLTRKESYTVGSVTAFWEKLVEAAMRKEESSFKEAALKILGHFGPRVVCEIMLEMPNMPIYTILQPYCTLLLDLKKFDGMVRGFLSFLIFGGLYTVADVGGESCEEHQKNPSTSGYCRRDLPRSYEVVYFLQGLMGLGSTIRTHL